MNHNQDSFIGCRLLKDLSILSMVTEKDNIRLFSNVDFFVLADQGGVGFM